VESLFERIGFLRPDLKDLIQIALVAYLIYRVLLLWVGTRAMQMLLGLIVLFGVYALAGVLELELIRYLLQVFFTYGAFAAIVVFQPELRSALTKLGQNRFFRFFSRLEESETALGLAAAAEHLSSAKIGALIAVEREVGLGEYAATGTRVQAQVTPELLATIFTPYSPLHDGAVIVRGDQIVAAGCILPLTQFPVADRTLGTRHRAAIGLSEETDAMVVVVSEETGAISVAQRGTLHRNLGGERLRDLLGAKAPPRATLREPSETPASVEVR
jgi:diadenylate cyclase